MSTNITSSQAAANAASASPAQTMNLAHEIAQAKQTPNWKSSDRHATTLFKSESLRLVLLGLHEGAELKTHSAPGILTVQVLEGHITFCTAQQSSDLRAGQLLLLPAGVLHSVQAHQDSFFLLTVAIAAVKG
ncbi:hypothetical protein GCM10011375_15830 [Hymenobacter qilianensis]|uniref:Cupin domain-containing protein n=2 Tax=Hymenobacter qilianensis TaxID=1385715 RepID=A0A7H0GU31_9BACT|nr:cupin domain-containing protein [Hymenobacter qilianensis]QNP51797.1 cupin domain-containing protein [Hymenobacter qilianensis]GGF61568.1 hypothetical protein GCM10011375_15830 [Hymenobacter qilianensis]